MEQDPPRVPLYPVQLEIRTITDLWYLWAIQRHHPGQPWGHRYPSGWSSGFFMTNVPEDYSVKGHSVLGATRSSPGGQAGA